MSGLPRRAAYFMRETVADRDFKYSGPKIFRRLGFDPAEIKFLLKNLVENEHWKKNGRAGEIALTATAVKTICREAENPPAFLIVGDCLIDPPEKKERDYGAPVFALPPAPIKMRVVRKSFNPRVLDAADPNGKICHVIVGNAGGYPYGAEFTALPSRLHLGFYEVVQPPGRSRW